MKLTKRVSAESSSGTLGAETAATPLIVGICVGSAAFVALVVLSVCLVVRRRSNGRSRRRSPLKQFLLPKDVKPVISFKTAAGPGGLKKSPSPVQSPENPERDFGSKSGGHQSPSMTRSASSCGGYGASRFGEEAEMLVSMMSNHSSEYPLDSSTSYSDAFPKPDEYDISKKGSVNFTLKYNFEKTALIVNIASATNLPPKKDRLGGRKSSPSDSAPSTLLDPYVKLQLLPEKQHKVKTRVVRNTLNPVYDEEFTFYGLNYNQLQSTTLHFAVIAFDRYSRDEIIGEVICPLHTIDLNESDKQASVSMELMNRTSKFQNAQNRGDILVSLSYQPATNKITAVVLKAKSLPKFDITGLADPYVKVYMLYNGQKIAKKKTHVKKRTLTPVFNESFVFDVPSGDANVLDMISFEFLVMDWDRVTKNEVMGRMDVGAHVKTVTGRSHWEEMRKNQRKQTAEWHRLRP